MTPEQILGNAAADIRADTAWWFAEPDPYDGVRGEVIAYVTATSPNGRVTRGISKRVGNVVSGEIG